MPEKPTFWNRMMAAMSGEVPADTLEAYRRASLAVYDALDHAEEHRRVCKSNGGTPWSVPPATQAELLCVWNAFVLQNLGDQFLEADYRGNPSTVGHVLPITADQILAFYGQVEGWLNRAQQAHYNPDYRLDIYIPAELPVWCEAEPCPKAHSHGMLEAMRSIRDHAGAAMLFLSETPEPANETEIRQKRIILQLYASAMSKARYAEDMHGANPTQDIYERSERHVKEAIEKFYVVGQLLAMPGAADEYAKFALQPPPPRTPAPSTPSLPATTSPDQFTLVAVDPPRQMPGEPGFDIWCLTDPSVRSRWKKDRAARRALQALWGLDPDPALTLRIQAEIDFALKKGDIRLANDRYGQRLGHFYSCPWAPVYEAVRPVNIGGTHISTMQQFLFNVSCEGVNSGAPFVREIMVSYFTPTTRFEYGDPDELPDDR